VILRSSNFKIEKAIPTSQRYLANAYITKVCLFYYSVSSTFFVLLWYEIPCEFHAPGQVVIGVVVRNCFQKTRQPRISENNQNLFKSETFKALIWTYFFGNFNLTYFQFSIRLFLVNFFCFKMV
jgi:hypothetical protein